MKNYLIGSTVKFPGKRFFRYKVLKNQSPVGKVHENNSAENRISMKSACNWKSLSWYAVWLRLAWHNRYPRPLRENEKQDLFEVVGIVCNLIFNDSFELFIFSSLSGHYFIYFSLELKNSLLYSRWNVFL